MRITLFQEVRRSPVFNFYFSHSMSHIFFFQHVHFLEKTTYLFIILNVKKEFKISYSLLFKRSKNEQKGGLWNKSLELSNQGLKSPFFSFAWRKRRASHCNFCPLQKMERIFSLVATSLILFRKGKGRAKLV